MTRSTRTILSYGLVAAAIVLAGAALLLAVFRPGFAWYYLLTAWLFSINITTFGYYAYDKSRAQSRSPRIPEVVLHTLAALGGSPAAYSGMVLFRHKTIKPAFRILFWLTVVFQVLLIAAILYRIYSGEPHQPAVR